MVHSMKFNKPFNYNLQIDSNSTIQLLNKYIRETAEEHGAKGVLTGLSGGIDSAVLACLAVRSLGPENVHVSYLFDRHSEKGSHEKAELVADWLGLKLESTDISLKMANWGVYASPIMSGAGYPRWLNRLVQNIYHRLFGETPFMSSLRLGSGTTSFSLVKKQAYDLAIRPIVKGFEARHIYRRTRLEQEAGENGWLLLGGANRSEVLVGWFVKGGIDDLPIQPLSRLYKSQVRQLADFLGVPKKIRECPPSPDMRNGITDEFGMGISYHTLDVILDLLAQDLTDKTILACGIAPEDLALVRELHRLSAWKRTSPSIPPPVDGGPDSELRLTARSDSVFYPE
jgi:NAD+ synthase